MEIDKMFNLSQIAKQAWTMIKAGLTKSAAFKKAWAIAKAISPLDILQNSSLVKAIKFWATGKIERTYVSLFAYETGYAGDRNFKIYFCHNSNKMVFEAGKGMTSRGFYTAIEQLKAQF
jgi:hypothetical protein